MGRYSEMIVTSAKPLIGLAQKSLEGIGPHNAARKPTWGLGGEVINCNHAAWVFGHLSMYPQRLVMALGQDAKPAEPPAGFGELFAAGTECRDDPGGTIYPSWETITRTYFRVMEAGMEAVAKAPDEALLKPNPNEKARALFPTIGTAAAFTLLGHVGMHLGQLSTWRRAMGLPGLGI